MTGRRVAVVGATGRVGSAICARLSDRFDVEPVLRVPGDRPSDVAARAATAADGGVIVNAAGMAHLERPTEHQVERMHEANVLLPVALADAALRSGTAVVHISSVKAVDDARTAYARAKREAEVRLEHEFADAFASAGLGLVVIRPLALLFPPFDAGKLRYLRPIAWVPARLVPAVRLPVLTGSTFLSAVASSVDDVLDTNGTAGLVRRDFGRADHATLRDVRTAMSTPASQLGSDPN